MGIAATHGAFTRPYNGFTAATCSPHRCDSWGFHTSLQWLHRRNMQPSSLRIMGPSQASTMASPPQHAALIAANHGAFTRLYNGFTAATCSPHRCESWGLHTPLQWLHRRNMQPSSLRIMGPSHASTMASPPLMVKEGVMDGHSRAAKGGIYLSTPSQLST